LNDDDHGVRLLAVSALVKLATYCEFVIESYLGYCSRKYEVEFRKAIGMAISSLITLLNDGNSAIRSAVVSALAELVGYGEFVALCYLDITNATMKLSFMK
jgi:HEAT repeat